MKQLFFIGLLVFILTSCDVAVLVDYSLYDMPTYNILIPKYLESTLKNTGVGDYEKLEMIYSFVSKEIKYTDDLENGFLVDKWQTPKETWKRKKGDCEDIAILSIWIACQYCNIKSGIEITQNPNTWGYHALQVYKGTIIKQSIYKRIDCASFKTNYSFSEALKTAKYIK